MMCKCLGCETEHKSRRNKSKHDVQNVTRTRNRGRKNRRKDVKRQNSLHLNYFVPSKKQFLTRLTTCQQEPFWAQAAKTASTRRAISNHCMQ